MSTTSAYRSLTRELRKASIAPSGKRNPVIASHFRALFEQKPANDNAFRQDIENAVTFELLDRYNPLVDLTAEERIEATARRVGLNMPVAPPKGTEER
ncbi:hypothetical protein PUNSTDRAFT_65406 [Punctularia strigosozonata HHB-11173 SS5]|uniref:uncharacterized protein n=1 Tax=Punctularia strigosozonata (strain HHB-11173) TaxID=741275 RepID=UPI0004417F16|nr:uncharacterized protein PUNSTDRAFT_65406 [Punctularia strigosozonata HHB-11173 SS5]EIN10691.1 hypothetical protein PUNSTDRAFT_65406 [Punctularia strigosozonata HHB-11173 SS5]